MAITLPIVPPYFDAPRVDYRVAQDLQLALDAGLGWLDKAYHIARVGIDASQKSTYPQIYLNDNTNEHADIRPDNETGAYSFFEIDNPFSVNTFEDEFTCFFSVVFWCNLALIDPAKDYDYTSELVKDAIDILAANGCEVSETETRPERIFDKYRGITQELKQHLLRKYSGFRITFSITKGYSDSCGGSAVDVCEQNIDRINSLETSVKDCVLASVCPAGDTDTFLNFVFGIGATADFTQTIVSGEEGTYTANTLTNVSSVAYYKNAVLSTLPITLVATDTLRVVPTITNTAIEARVKLTGTY